MTRVPHRILVLVSLLVATYAALTLASAFSVRMRHATDLPTVAHDLDVTVRRAIAPSRVDLWLRRAGQWGSGIQQADQEQGLRARHRVTVLRGGYIS